MPQTVIPPPFEAYKGDQPYIFASYAHKDCGEVFADLTVLCRKGYRIWYDEGIDPGNEWPEDVASALTKCDFFIVFISPNAVASQNVKNEISYAVRENKPFLAIHLVETELSLGLKLRLGDIQAILKHRLDAATYVRQVEAAIPPSLLERLTASSDGKDSRPARKTLLWVEDDPFIRQRITPKLEDAGFTVLTSDNAGTAMSIFSRQGRSIDLAILDVMVPAGDAFDEKATMGGFATGLALARWLHERKPDLPLVAFSLSTERDVMDWFLRHGAAFVEKSYDGGRLIDCVQGLLLGAYDTKNNDPETVAAGSAVTGMAVTVGHRVGRYEIRGLLGQGGMGNVYLGWDDELQREVAIKSPRRERFNSDAEMEKTLGEARTAAKLKHPNIVSVFDICRASDGTPLIVMEYVEGTSLRRLMNAEKLAYSRIRQIIAPVADALQFAHAVGFVHRDVKPSNILIDKTGVPRLSDFGLAISEHTQANLAGQIAGTLPYMSPEQVRGESHHLDGRADIWALGVVIYEAIVGQCPFEGDNENEVVDAIIGREPKPPRIIDELIPVDLEQVCLKCLRKNVAERYTTAADLSADIRGQSPVIDWEAALNEVQGYSEILVEIVDIALEELPRVLSEIRNAISERRASEVQRFAHTLKAALTHLCARTAAGLAAQMERCGKDQDNSQAERLFPMLVAEIKCVMDEAERWQRQ